MSSSAKKISFGSNSQQAVTCLYFGCGVPLKASYTNTIPDPKKQFFITYFRPNSRNRYPISYQAKYALLLTGRWKYRAQLQILNLFIFLLNRLFQGFRRHLGGGAVAVKITANVWEIVQLSNLVTPLLYNGV